MTKRLALFGLENDPQVRQVRKLATEQGHEALIISPHNWAGTGQQNHTYRIGSTGGLDVRFGDDDPLADAAWIRHLPPPYPHIRTQPSLPPLDRTSTFIALMNARERCTAALAIIDAMRARGAPVINPLAPGMGIQNKVTQLMTMASGGVVVPETLITDDPEAAKAFAADRRVIFKPTTGGALTHELNEETTPLLESITAAPVIFQELVPGDDVRVTVVDQKIVSCVVVVIAEGTLDFRSDEDYRVGGGKYREVTLEPEVEKAVLQTAELLDLRFSGIDVRVDPEAPTKYAVLEANPCPTYWDIEKKMGHPISQALVDALTA